MLRRVIASLIATALLVAAPFVSPMAAVADEPIIPSRRWVGFYVPGAPLSCSPLSRLESKVKLRAEMSNYFQHTEQDFTAEQAGNAAAHGAVPLITLELRDPAKGVSQPEYSLASIASGAHDEYLENYARGAAEFGKPVWLRLFHEMNGNWYPWCGTVNGNTPADFIAAWRHVHDVFVEQGASNVSFVWCANIDSIDAAGRVNSNPNNEIRDYWPGEQYVDYMALDGYNFGTGDGMTWRSFGSLFAAPYAEVTALSNKPLFVAETACATSGGNKAAWVADMFAVIPKRFPRIIGVGWFNAKKDRDWRIDSDSAALASFVAGSSGSAWAGKRQTSMTIKPSSWVTRTRRNFVLSGFLKPAYRNDRVRVDVLAPGSSSWKWAGSPRISSTRGNWRLDYRGTRRGSYRFRVRYSGSMTRTPSASRTIVVRVR